MLGIWERGKPHQAGAGGDQGTLHRGCCSSDGPRVWVEIRTKATMTKERNSMQ